MSLGFGESGVGAGYNPAMSSRLEAQTMQQQQQQPPPSAAARPGQHLTARGVDGKTVTVPPLMRLEAVEYAVATLADKVRDQACDDDGQDQTMIRVDDRIEDAMQYVRNSTLHVVGVAGDKGTRMHGLADENDTQTFSDDLLKARPRKVPAGTRLRLLFPQHTTKGGDIYMLGMQVDPQTMDVTQGWVQIYSKSKNLQLVSDFSF